MDLFFYTTDIENAGKALWSLYQDLGNNHNGEFYMNIYDLAGRLRHLKSDSAIAVLLPDNSIELEDLLAIQDLLERARIILILPDRNEDTIKKGFALFPRYLTYVDANFDWVAAVLHKMLSNNNGNNRFG